MRREQLRDLFIKQKVAGSYEAWLESITCSLAKFRAITPQILEDARRAARSAA